MLSQYGGLVDIPGSDAGFSRLPYPDPRLRYITHHQAGQREVEGEGRPIQRMKGFADASGRASCI